VILTSDPSFAAIGDGIKAKMTEMVPLTLIYEEIYGEL